MDWKQAIGHLRKSLTSHLATHEFRYAKANEWERDLGDWHASLTIEFFPRQRGNAREVFVSCVLIQRQELSPERLAAFPPVISLPGYRNFVVHSLWGPEIPGLQELFMEPEELDGFAKSLAQAFDETWLPWMITASAQGIEQPGVRHTNELAHKDLDCT